jgi:hypothetical protein
MKTPLSTVMAGGSSYYALVQRLSLFGTSGPTAIPASTFDNGAGSPWAGVHFDLLNGQAFKLISIDANIFDDDSPTTGELSVVSFGVFVFQPGPPIGPAAGGITIKAYPFKGTCGLQLGGNAGLALHASDHDLLAWDDYKAQGGLSDPTNAGGGIIIGIDADIKNSDAVNSHSVASTLAVLIEIYAAQTILTTSLKASPDYPTGPVNVTR